jgi:hypothetical protein
MASPLFPLSYPAHCACGHSEWVYGWTRAEIEYQKKVRCRYFCTGCSISPEVRKVEGEAREMPWLGYEGKRQWVLKRVRNLVARGEL